MNRTPTGPAGNDAASEHRDATLPVVAPSTIDLATDTPPVRVAGVLLAAGTSSRFGDTNKLLAELDGKPVVRHAARALLDSAVVGVTVVLGHEADRVREALSGLDLAFVVNETHAEGQSTSLRAGVEALADDEADAAVFALGDMPLVRPESIDALVWAFRAGLGDPLAAAYRGTRGNPVLFGMRHFDRLTAVSGDTGGRALLFEEPNTTLVETGDPGVLRDVDTPADFEGLG